MIGTGASSVAMRFLARFVCLLMVFGGLAYVYGTTLVDLLLPAFQSELNWLDDTYRIDRLFVDTEGADKVVRIVVGLAHCVVLPDGAHCGDPRGLANASTLQANVTLPAALLLAIALAWPAQRPRDYLLRVLGVIPALALLWALDVPFILWSALWTLHVDAFAPGLFSPLLIWGEFLQSGGRLALAALLGVAAAGVPRSVVHSWARRRYLAGKQGDAETAQSVSSKQRAHQDRRAA